ncbi:MAG: S9 family peptidase [Conexivisphaerales archaeon]
MTQKITPNDISKLISLSNPSLSPDGEYAALSVHRADVEKDEYKSDVWLVSTLDGKATRFTFGERDYNPAWSPDGLLIAFLSRRGLAKEDKGNELYVISSKGGEARRVIRRKEGIDSFVWSPDSKKIAFVSQVVNEEQDDVKVIDRIGYWFNGKGWIFNARQHLFLLRLDDATTVQLTEGQFDVKFAHFSHDGSRIAYGASTDDSKPYIVDIFILDLTSLKSKKITNSDMTISSIAWSPDDSTIAINGNKFPRGFASHDHIWTIPADGNASPSLLEDLDRNKENSLNSDVRAYSHGSSQIKWVGEFIYYYVSNGGSVHLYRIRPNAISEPIVNGSISVEGFDVKGNKIAYVAMNSMHPEELYLYDNSIKKLTSFNDTFVGEFNVIQPSSFKFTASDGAEVEGWIMKPNEFTNRYPAILYIHGGPKTSFGNAFMFEFQVFANAGYAVIYMNPRGSDGYSEEFADIRRNYGKRDYQDLMEGLEYTLQNFDYVNSERLGVAGGSYGGFMTNWIIGHTKRFKAAVTDRSIASWVSFFATSDIGREFTIDQIGTDPWTDPTKISEQSPITYMKNVDTPTLVIHSQEDYRCWMVEGLQVYTSLKYLGKDARLVIFPAENHDLSRSGKPKHRIARLNHYLNWFDKYLKV